MHKGRYVALVEYDFMIDESDPNVRPIEYIRDMLRNGTIETGIANVLCDEVFDTSCGSCKVTQTFFDMYEVAKEE